MVACCKEKECTLHVVSHIYSTRILYVGLKCKSWFFEDVVIIMAAFNGPYDLLLQERNGLICCNMVPGTLYSHSPQSQPHVLYPLRDRMENIFMAGHHATVPNRPLCLNCTALNKLPFDPLSLKLIS